MAHGSEDGSRATFAPRLRRGPGAVAWISLALLLIAIGALVYASIAGAYASALVSLIAVVALVFPTLILMAVWIEVHLDNRKVVKAYGQACQR